MKRLVAVPYSPKYAVEWDRLVSESPVGTVLHTRRFLDYHGTKFHESSYLLFAGGSLEAVLPAIREGDVIRSNGASTFGGLIMRQRAQVLQTLEAWKVAVDGWRQSGARSVQVTPTTWPFIPEGLRNDEAALTSIGFEAVRTQICSVLNGRSPGPRASRRRSIERARRSGLQVLGGERIPTADIMRIVTTALDRHDAIPVHTDLELEDLRRRLGQQLKVVGVASKDALCAIAVLLRVGQAWHAQYLAADNFGRGVNAIDLVIAAAIEDSRDTDYFTLGSSSERNGTLNTGLQWFKESWGSETYVITTYLLNLLER